MGILSVFNESLIGESLAWDGMRWDATGGCDEITPLLQAPAEFRVIGYITWMGFVPVG